MQIELIPAIDILDGKCVRLAKGDYSQKTVYDDDPLAVAQKFERLGFRRLHIVDLDGARSRHIVNIGVLERISSGTHLIIDFGGGLKSDADITKAFDHGAHLVTVGSVAVSNKPLFTTWLQRYGSDRIILGADVRNGKVSINGWCENSDQDLLPFLEEYVKLGVHHVLCTDISKDGMLNGPALPLYQQVMSAFPGLHLIASGGVSSAADILQLEAGGIPAVVFGKAFYEGRIDLTQLPQPWN